MAKNNNAPAQAGANPEDLEATKAAAQAKAEAQTKAEAEAAAQAQAEAQAKAEAEAQANAQVNEGSDTKKESKIVFKSEDGSKYELLVKEFTFKGKKYASKEAIKENTDVLETLVEAKSFILKKV